MYLLSRFFGGASKLWRTKDFGVDEIEGGSTGTWLPENVSATKQILHFQNKKNYTKTFFFSRFFSAIMSRQHGCLSNIFNNFGQNFPRKCSKENFGKIIESQVSWRKYQKDSTKKLDRSSGSDGVKETRENDDERKSG